LSAFVFIDEMRALFDLDTRATQPEDVAKPHIVSGWAFRPIWRNSGETQTRNMVAHVDCELRDRPLPPRYTFPENHTNNTRLLLGPKSGAIGGSPRTFTLEEMRRVQTGHAFLYLWGWARYENVFQRQTHGHVTRYCVQVVIITDPGLSNCVFNYLVHTEGNCSDSECAMMGLP
jgi:hypothetical protein